MFFAPVIRNRAFSPNLRSFDRDFERFVDEVFFHPVVATARTTRAAHAAVPRCEVTQGDDAWTLRLDLPGVGKQDLSIGAEGQVLRIETRPEAARQAKYAWELPQDVDVGASSATLENGVLTLTLARAKPVAKVTQIPLS
ncbi:MAG: Hsp20/alpha crystallin family protein [Burkholderiaceae bacterium]